MPIHDSKSINSQGLYTAANAAVVSHIPQAAQTILDIGCGTGTLGKIIKQNNQVKVIGITYSSQEAEVAKEWLDDVWVTDLNQFQPEQYALEKFDCIICSHVLEHLHEPQCFLSRLKPFLRPDATVIVALPNTLNFRQRLEFIQGRFRYAEAGIMDRTHFRFFDWDTAFELLIESGYQVVHRFATGYFPLPLIRQHIRPMARLVDQAAVDLMPGLFGIQFVLISHPQGME